MLIDFSKIDVENADELLKTATIYQLHEYASKICLSKDCAINTNDEWQLHTVVSQWWEAAILIDEQQESAETVNKRNILEREQ